MPAAEAKKAEGASDDIRLTPRPPLRTGMAGLSPLSIGEISNGDGANTVSEQTIIIIIIISSSSSSSSIHYFTSCLLL